MARVEINETVTQVGAGGVLRAVSGASVLVTERESGDPATVYAAESGGTTVTNPLTTTSGRIEGWLELGSYDLEVTYGVGSREVTYIQPFEADPSSALVALQAADEQLAEDTATLVAAEVTARTAADALKADLVAGVVPSSQLPAERGGPLLGDYGDLSSSLAVKVNDTVSYDGAIYRRKTAGTLGASPPSDGATWELIGGGTGAQTAVANTFLATQVFTSASNPATGKGTSQPFVVEHDGSDTYIGLQVRNKTTIENQEAAAWYTGGDPAYRFPYLQFAANYNAGPAGVWDIGLDVSKGSGSTGSSDRRHDLAFYHRWRADTSKNVDFLYFRDDPFPALGIGSNLQGGAGVGLPPAAMVYMASAATDGRAVLGLGDPVGQAGYLLSFYKQGTLKGGFYKWETGALAGLVALSLGSSSLPTELLDVYGGARAQQFVFSNAKTAYADNSQPVGWSSAANAGTYPFEAGGNGHLVLKPRTEQGSSYKDFLVVGGVGPLPILQVHGDKKNVGINPDPAAPYGLFGGGSGVLGIRNVTTAPTTGVGGRPSNGGVTWVQSAVWRVRVGTGSVGFGQTEPVSGHGGFQAGAADSNTLDVKLYRKAANLWMADSAIGTARTAAPADADLSAGEVSFYFDSTNGAAKVKFKGKSANGTVVSGELALA